MNLIQLEGVTRSYFKAGRVLHDLDLQIQAGQVVALIGQKDSGKTTLLRLILGLIKTHKGVVNVFGLNPRKHPIEIKQATGYVAESRILPGSLRAPEIFAIYQDLYPKWDQAMAKELAERFKIMDFQKVHSYSAPRARNLALLLALAVHPELLLIDTPDSGISEKRHSETLRIAHEYAAGSHCAILFSCHQWTEAEQIADRVLVLNNGKISLDEPCNPFAADPTAKVEELLCQ
jgi:ABC-2 type transport system ATP-binding protein